MTTKTKPPRQRSQLQPLVDNEVFVAVPGQEEFLWQLGFLRGTSVARQLAAMQRGAASQLADQPVDLPAYIYLKGGTARHWYRFI